MYTCGQLKRVSLAHNITSFIKQLHFICILILNRHDDKNLHKSKSDLLLLL